MFPPVLVMNLNPASYREMISPLARVGFFYGFRSAMLAVDAQADDGVASAVDGGELASHAHQFVFWALAGRRRAR